LSRTRHGICGSTIRLATGPPSTTRSAGSCYAWKRNRSPGTYVARKPAPLETRHRRHLPHPVTARPPIRPWYECACSPFLHTWPHPTKSTEQQPKPDDISAKIAGWPRFYLILSLLICGSGLVFFRSRRNRFLKEKKTWHQVPVCAPVDKTAAPRQQPPSVDQAPVRVKYGVTTPHKKSRIRVVPLPGAENQYKPGIYPDRPLAAAKPADPRVLCAAPMQTGPSHNELQRLSPCPTPHQQSAQLARSAMPRECSSVAQKRQTESVWKSSSAGKAVWLNKQAALAPRKRSHAVLVIADRPPQKQPQANPHHGSMRSNTGVFNCVYGQKMRTNATSPDAGHHRSCARKITEASSSPPSQCRAAPRSHPANLQQKKPGSNGTQQIPMSIRFFPTSLEITRERIPAVVINTRWHPRSVDPRPPVGQCPC